MDKLSKYRTKSRSSGLKEIYFIQAIWLDKTLSCQNRAGDLQAHFREILKYEKDGHDATIHAAQTKSV